MEILNIKIFNLSIITWIFIIFSILFLLNVSNTREKMNNNTIYNFNTTWCRYSREFQPIWDQFAKENKDSNITIKDVKCDDESLELCNKYPIRGFPSVLLDINGKVTEYNGKRTVEELTDFVKKNI